MMKEMGHEKGRMHAMLCALFCILFVCYLFWSFVFCCLCVESSLFFFLLCYEAMRCLGIYGRGGDKGCMHVKRPCFFFCPSTTVEGRAREVHWYTSVVSAC